MKEIVVVLLNSIILADAREEEREEFSNEDRACAVMLLGSIGFMMSIFYLTNHNEERFRMYAWRVVSQTISIFSAVLLFQAFNGLVEGNLVVSYGFNKIGIAFGHMMFWFFFLQLALAQLTGAIDMWSCLARPRPASNKAVTASTQPLLANIVQVTPGPDNQTVGLLEQWSQCDACGSWVPQKTEEQRMEDEAGEVQDVNRKSKVTSWAMLLGHMTGFATINAWAVLQQSSPADALHVFGIVLLAYLSTRAIYYVLDTVRIQVSLQDDGQVDDMERLWDEVAEETEADIIGLGMSFLLVQGFRMLVTGYLPNAEGEDEPRVVHTDLQSGQLFLIGVLMMVAEVVRTLSLPSLGRITAHAQLITAMVFAWCVYVTLRWLTDAHAGHAATGMLKEVYVAIVVTVLSLASIWLVEYFASLDCTGAATDKFLRSVIGALSFSIGFSWERCFDLAVSSMASSTPRPSLVKIVLAIILAAVVIPAWRWWILPQVLEMEDALKEEDEAEEEQDASQGSTPVNDGMAKHAKSRASLVGLSHIQLQTRMAQTLDELQRKKRQHSQELKALRMEHDRHKQRADFHQAQVAQLQSMLEAYAEEVKHVQVLADALEQHHGP